MLPYRSLILTDIWQQTNIPCLPEQDFWSPKAKRLCEWWWHERQEGMPLKADFDILEHFDAAADVFLVTVQDDGSYVTQIIGEHARVSVEEGRLGSVIRHDDDRRFIRSLHDHYTSVVQERVPFRCEGTAVYDTEHQATFKGIDCPLSTDGETVSHIVGILNIQ